MRLDSPKFAIAGLGDEVDAYLVAGDQITPLIRIAAGTRQVESPAYLVELHARLMRLDAAAQRAELPPGLSDLHQTIENVARAHATIAPLAAAIAAVAKVAAVERAVAAIERGATARGAELPAGRFIRGETGSEDVEAGAAPRSAPAALHEGANK
jgi:hypothetical protein